MLVDPALPLHRRRRVISAAILSLVVPLFPFAAKAATPTQTTLALSTNQAQAGQIVTLTATVSGGPPSLQGTVTLLNGNQVLGTVQLNESTDTATLKMGFPPAVYSITARFNANTLFQSSQSGVQQLTVSGTEPTITTVTAAPDGSNYDFTASVFGYGFPAPTGTASLTVVSTGMNLGDIGLVGPGMNTFLQQETLQVGKSPQGGIASGDFNGDGCPDLAVVNQGVLIPNENTVSILLGVLDPVHQQCTGMFQAQMTFPVDQAPDAIAVGDFNADGILDLAVACHNSNAIDVLFGNGDGTFQAAVRYPTDTAVAVAVGDFNGDGLPDLATAGISSGLAGVLTNNGDGSFTQQQTYPVGVQPTDIAVGDFDGDGNLDMAVSASGSNQVAVLLGNGDGTFQQPTQFYGNANNPQGIVTADFNRDGCLDLAFTNFNDNTVSVLLGHVNNGKCDGTFPQQQPDSPTGSNPLGITVVDFNGDGILDVAVACAVGTTVDVLLGKGDGSFQPEVTYQVGQSPTDITAADFLGDGVPDIAVTNVSDNTASVLLGGTATAGQIKNIFVGPPGQQQIDATYTPNTNFYFGSQGSVQVQGASMPTTTGLSVAPNPASAGQVVTLTATVTSNGVPVTVGTVSFLSGKQLLATVQVVQASGTATLKTRFEPGMFSLTAQYNATDDFGASQSAPQQLTVNGTEPTITTLTDQADGSNWDFTISVFGFGFPVTTGSASLTDLTTQLSLGNVGLAGPGMSSFIPPVGSPYATGMGPGEVAMGDFNGDGIADLVVADGANTVSVMLGMGDGSFPTHVEYMAGTVPYGVAVADFDGDGFADLAVTSFSVPGTVSVLVGNGDGTFKAPKTYTLGNMFVRDIAVADFNGDGFPDLAVVDNDGFVIVLLNNGDGTFTQQMQTYGVGAFPNGIAVADFNGDGVADLAVTNYGLNGVGNTVSVLLGNGDGTFQAQITSGTGVGPEEIAVGDFNGDGKADLAVTNFGNQNGNGNTVSVLLGDGTGNFSPAPGSPQTVGSGPFGVAVADFNGDGKTDLAVTNANDGTVSVLLGDGTGNFSPAPGSPYGVGRFPVGIAVADFNGDGVPDVAAANEGANTASILLGGTVTSGQLKNVPVNGSGVHMIQSTYAPNNGFYTGSLSNIVNVNGNGSLIPTTTTVSSSVNPSALNQSVMFTATVAGSNGGSPTGTVAFTADGVLIVGCGAVQLMQLAGASEASCVTSTLALGSHTIQATYSGDGNFAPSAGSLVQMVGNVTTQTALSASPPMSSYLQLVTFTATVTASNGGAPTGTVTFSTQNGFQPLCQPVTLQISCSDTCSIATCSTAVLPVGVDAIAAAYSGDASYSPSNTSIQYTVTGNIPTTTVSVSPASPVTGQVVTLTATVSNGGDPVTSGTVFFGNSGNGQTLGTVQLEGMGAPAPGTATLKTRLAPGNYFVVAEFQGIIGNQPSGSEVDFTVTGAEPSLTTLTDQPDGNNFDFSATVFGFGFPVATGQVKFNDLTDGFNLGNVVLSGQGTSTFQPQQTYASGNTPRYLTTGDFNGDGIPDVAVSNFADNTVSVLLGKGDGTFQPQVTYAVGEGPLGITAGDFNGDGHLDLAVVNDLDNTVSVLLGNGDGTFQNQQVNQVGGSPDSIATGDFNGDGNVDLAVTNATSFTVGILLGNGNGTFQQEQEFSVGKFPQGVAVADFNGDGFSDLAVVNNSDNNVSILLGNGDGTFQAQQTYAVGGSPFNIAIAGSNLAVTNNADATVSVLVSNGDGTFMPQQILNVDVHPFGITTADFNGDGIPDLAVTNDSDNTVGVLLGNGDGGFQPQQTFPIGGQPQQLAAADFNGDGVPDLVAANQTGNNVSILLAGTTISAQLLNIPITGSGNHMIQSSYVPDGASIYAASASNIVTVPGGGKAPTSIALTEDPSPVNYGNNQYYTAVVQSPGGGTPTGTLNFMEGSILLGTASLVANASGQGSVATYVNNTLVVGSHTVYAVYNGDSEFSGATSNNVTVQVLTSFTLTGLNGSSGTVSPGGMAQFTVSVDAAWQNNPLIYAVMTCSAPAGLTCSLQCPPSPPSPPLPSGQGNSCVLSQYPGSGTSATVTVYTSGLSRLTSPLHRSGKQRIVAAVVGLSGFGLLGLVLLPGGLRRKAAGGVLLLVIVVLCFGTSCGTSFAPGISSSPVNNTFYISVMANLREQNPMASTGYNALGVQVFLYALLIK
jgi:Bacterial Ig-like domain (group 3)/FG-GAP-like repeat/FG-GAP repeat